MSAVTVLKVIGSKLELDEESLKNILTHPRAINKYAVVISITGSLRKGKTTFLNFIKLYMEKCDENIDENTIITGFEAKQGSEAVTKGIVMWSIPLIMNIEGHDLAVFLVDTEGAFEPGSDNTASSAIFALSSLISSIQIFNVMQMVDQRDFELLALFGRYAKTISSASRDSEAFQKLILLVRDWSSPINIKYGYSTLDHYLNKTGKKNSESKEWQIIKQEFEISFNDISCFMLPAPGERVTVCKEEIKTEFCFNDFNGEFITQTKILFDGLITDSVVKMVGGEKLTGVQIFKLFKDYYNVFKSGKVAPPESILKATAKEGYLRAFEKALKYYKKQIRKYMDDKHYFVTVAGVKEKLEETDSEASGIFEESTPIQHKELQKEYENKLLNETKDIKEESVQKATMTQNMRSTIFTLGSALLGGSAAKFTGMNAREAVASTIVPAITTAVAMWYGNKDNKKEEEESHKEESKKF